MLRQYIQNIQPFYFCFIQTFLLISSFLFLNWLNWLSKVDSSSERHEKRYFFIYYVFLKITGEFDAKSTFQWTTITAGISRGRICRCIIGPKFTEWRSSFQGDIVISIRDLARSRRCGKLSQVLHETIVIRHASTFAFNCVCKRTLGRVSPTRHFDGRTSDVKDSSRIYDVTSALHVQERNLDVTAVKVEVSSLIFALLAGLFSLASFARWIENEIFVLDDAYSCDLQRYAFAKRYICISIGVNINFQIFASTVICAA